MAGKYWFANHPSGKLLAGSKVETEAEIGAGAEGTVAITVTGAALGDVVLGYSCSADMQDMMMDAHVTAADTVTLTISNVTDGALTLDASATFRALVLPSAAVDDIASKM